MGKGTEQEEVSLNSQDCGLMCCLQSHTVSTRGRVRSVRGEDILDNMRTTWTCLLCQPPGISLTLRLVGTRTQRAWGWGKDTTPVDGFSGHWNLCPPRGAVSLRQATEMTFAS